MAEGAVRHVTLPYAPRAAFLPFHQREQRFAALVCHRRAGKTVSTINDTIKRAILCPRDHGRYGYIGPLLSQAKETAWEYLKRFAQPLIVDKNEGELWVQLVNGSRIRIHGADNPDRLRGPYFDGVVLDEYADMKPVVWTEVVRPMLADRLGWATFIGTPKGRNSFYTIFRNATKDPEWFHMLLKASESGILDADEIAALVKDMPPPIIAQEMECSFEAPTAIQFIAGEIVDAARARVAGRSGARVMGVDVARFGDDRSVILVRTDRLEYIRVLKGVDTQQLAALVVEEAKAWRPEATFVDGVGVGGGVIDRLRALQYSVFEVQAGGRANASDRYVNKRAEMWGVMRDWLKERGALPAGDHVNELCDDLQSPQYKYDNAGRILLEGKDDMKARGLPSPDIGDALALTFAEPIASPDMRVAWQNEPQQRDFDPLDDYLR